MPDAIRLVCPECDAVHRVKEITLGKLYRCKKCKSGLITMTPAVLVCPSCGSTTPPSHIEVSRLVTCQECEDAPLMTVRFAGVGQSTRLHRDSTRDFVRDQGREAGGFLADEADGPPADAAQDSDTAGFPDDPLAADSPAVEDLPPGGVALEPQVEPIIAAGQPGDNNPPVLIPEPIQSAADSSAEIPITPAASAAPVAQTAAVAIPVPVAAPTPVRKQASGAPVINPQYAAREKAAIERAQAARAAEVALSSAPASAPAVQVALNRPAELEPPAAAHPAVAFPIAAAEHAALGERVARVPGELAGATTPALAPYADADAPEHFVPAGCDALTAPVAPQPQPPASANRPVATPAASGPAGQIPLVTKAQTPAPRLSERSGATVLQTPQSEAPACLPADAPSQRNPVAAGAIDASNAASASDVGVVRPPRRLHDTAFITRRSAELLEHAEKTIAESFREEQPVGAANAAPSTAAPLAGMPTGGRAEIAACAPVVSAVPVASSAPVAPRPAAALPVSAGGGADDEGLDLQRLRQILLDLQQPYLHELARNRLHVPVWIPVAFALLLFGLFGWLIGSLDSLRDDLALKNRQLEGKEQELSRQQNRLDNERARLAGDNQRLIQLIPQLQQVQAEKLRLEKDLEEILHKYDALQRQQKKFSGFPAGPELGPNE